MSRQPPTGPRCRESGLSLIELMITLVVSLLLLGGLIQIYLSNKQSYNAQEQLARMQESGRFAMELITRDLRRAGYWGGSVDLRRIERGNPGPITAPNVSNTCGFNDPDWGRMIRWRVSGLNNTNAGYACATGYVNGSDILTVRYAGPGTIATADANANGLYLLDNTDSGAIVTGTTWSSNSLLEIAGDNVVASLRPLVSHAYYVGDSGRACPGGEAIPALRRVRLNPETGRTLLETEESEEIASGVEDLQVQYLLGGNYVNANQITGDEWLAVSAVRVWLLVRGECPESGLVNDTTYPAMGDRASFTPNDNFRRQLYVSTVMLRNTVVGDGPVLIDDPSENGSSEDDESEGGGTDG